MAVSPFKCCITKKRLSSHSPSSSQKHFSHIQPPNDLDPDLMGFCSHLHIIPVDMEFHDDNYDGSDSSVFNQSSDIKEESKLKSFTQALQMAQTAALKKEIENKRGPYSKKSKRTHRRHKQYCTELASKGFLSVSEYMSLKGSSGPEKHDTLTPELDAIAL